MPKKSIEFSTDSWGAIGKRSFQMFVSDSPVDVAIDWSVKPHGDFGNRAVANMVTLHGDGATQGPSSAAFETFHAPSL